MMFDWLREIPRPIIARELTNGLYAALSGVGITTLIWLVGIMFGGDL